MTVKQLKEELNKYQDNMSIVLRIDNKDQLFEADGCQVESLLYEIAYNSWFELNKDLNLVDPIETEALIIYPRW